MWSSIEQILSPPDFAQALAALQKPGAAILAGGSYMNTEQNPETRILVDVSTLVSRDIQQTNEFLKLGAGLSLQEIIEHFHAGKPAELAEAARQSCFSKNIRNQRQLGGEIGHSRPDSELNIYLHAVQARLLLAESEPVLIHNWDGKGIIDAVQVETEDLRDSRIRRFALLPSAPAFLILVANRRGQALRVSLGGRLNSIHSLEFSCEPTPEDIKTAAGILSKELVTDHYGSIEYKHKLILKTLSELQESLCG